MKNLFKSDSELMIAGSRKSSIRYIMIQSSRMAWVLVIVSGLVLLIQAWKHGDINWYGYAAFVGSITTLVGAAITGKVIQHKQEQNNLNNGQSEQVRLDERGDQEPGGS